jgi:aspartokinase
MKTKILFGDYGFYWFKCKTRNYYFGRNGSNYTASLVANYINAEELQNFTHVDGIYTANQNWY